MTRGEVSVSFDPSGSSATAPLHHRRAGSPPIQPPMQPPMQPRAYPGGGPGFGPGGGMPFMSFDVGPPSSFAPPPRVGISGGLGTFEDEPPLLEELGINIPHITKKTLSILNPLRLNTDLHDDGDMSGPIIFCVIFGLCQLLHQKVHFGVILGWGFVASLFLYTVFNLLVGNSQCGVDLYRTCSLVGYSLIPMILFSCISFFTFGPIVKVVLAVLSVLWCVRTSSGLLMALVPHAEEQRWLIAYACALVYTAFSLLVVF
eukprot:TRINITY_DN4497_c0_g1_i1.p1 TRINITY_DN4497_c0_g1~~TRINITY_DN4497_c0_g1_i1.p1  ORF type:complete len:259 (+),score=31.21 TRINITY_DN4497_c0_g1_i1:92-868(+)